MTLGFTRAKSNICRKVAVQGFGYTANNVHLFTNSHFRGSVCCGELEEVPNPHLSRNFGRVVTIKGTHEAKLKKLFEHKSTESYENRP